MYKTELNHFRKRWLQWVLNFSSAMLRNLHDERYLREATFFCSPYFELENEEEFFEYFMRRPPKKKEINLTQLQQILKLEVKFITGFASRFDGRIRPMYSTSKSLRDINVCLDVRDDGFFEIGYEVRTPYNRAVLNLLKLVEHLSIDSVIECKGCKKYFIDFTERKKIYCNSSCASRHYAEMKRIELKEKHPRKYEAYKKRMREYMRKLRRDRKKGLRKSMRKEA